MLGCFEEPKGEIYNIIQVRYDAGDDAAGYRMTHDFSVKMQGRRVALAIRIWESAG